MSLITEVYFIGGVCGHDLGKLVEKMVHNLGDTTGWRGTELIENDTMFYRVTYNYLDFDAFKQRYKEVFGGKDDYLTVIIDDERDDQAYVANFHSDSEQLSPKIEL